VVSWVNALRSKPNRMTPNPTSCGTCHVLHDSGCQKPSRTELMQRSGQIAARAHVRAMRHCKPGLYEYDN